MKTSNIRKLTALPLDAAGKPLSSNGQTPTFIRTSYKFSGSASQQVCRPMTTKCNYPTGSQKNCDSLLLTTTLSHLSRFERFYTVLTKNKYIFDTVIVKVFFLLTEAYSDCLPKVSGDREQLIIDDAIDRCWRFLIACIEAESNYFECGNENFVCNYCIEHWCVG